MWRSLGQSPEATALADAGSIAIYSWSRFEGSHPRSRSSGRWCRHQRGRETDDTKGHKGTRVHQHTIQQTNHCTPPLTALGKRLRTWHAVAMQCGVELLVSNSRTPPHCEGHPPSQWTSQRWGWAIPMQPLPQSGISVRNGAPPRCHIAPPRWLLPTLPYSPPHANQRGVQLHGGMEQQGGTP